MKKDAGKRNRAWLEQYARQSVSATARNKQYLAYVASWDGPLDLADPGLGAANHEDAYNISRSGGAALGRKAFLYTHRGTASYHNPSELQVIKEGLRTFCDKQDAQGRYVWGDGDYYNKGTHEHVWRLEPLIWSSLWLGDALSAAERKKLDRSIQLAANYLVKHPWVDLSNQGIIWCYGLWLVGLYLSKPRYITLAEKHADAILGKVLDEQDQVREASWRYYRGGGPCSNYSFTGWTYIMLYRLVSGRRELDAKFIATLKWFTHYLTHTGLPMVSSASVRKSRARVAVSDVLYGLEFYTRQEPHFSTVVQRYLPEAVASRMGHALHPGIWAMLAHEPVKKKPVTPQWAAGYEGHYDTPVCQYSVIHHRYQTGVSMRGVFPGKGIQTFAWGDEKAIVKSTEDLFCTTTCGDVDTAMMNVDSGPFGWETHIRRRIEELGHDMPARWTSIVTRRKHVWECSLFTTDCVIHMTGCAADAQGRRLPLQSRWVLNTSESSRAKLDLKRKCVTFTGRAGCVHFLAQRAKLVEQDGVQVLELSADDGPLVVGLSDSSLKLGQLKRKDELLTFSDGTGSWMVGWRSLLSEDGNLRRWRGNIVKEA